MDTSSTTGNGGNLTLVAGANFSTPVAGTPIKVTGGTNLATVRIDLTGGSTPLATITTNTSKAGSSAGNIVMVAYGGGGLNAGEVLTSASTNITAQNTGASGSGGSLTIISGATVGTGISLLSPVNTSGAGVSNGGSISPDSALLPLALCRV